MPNPYDGIVLAKTLAVLASGLVPLALALPLFGPGLHATHDGLYHLFRAAQLRVCLAEGTWFPRWAPDFAQGLGYPLFNFYAPLASYEQVLFLAAGLPPADSLKAALATALAVASAGAFCLVRGLFGGRAGLLAAIAYAYAPASYNQAFVRADLAELLAVALLPWVLWGFRRLALAPAAGNVALAAGLYAILVLSHNLTAFYFSGALAAYVLGWWAVTRKKQTGMALVAALLLGLALSAYFWLPALGERGWVQIERLAAPYGPDYRNYFVPLGQLFLPQFPVDVRHYGAAPEHRLGSVQVLLALAGLAALARQKLAPATRWQVGYFAGLAVAFAFLATAPSAFVWQVLPFGGLVQFPWRFLDVASLGMAVLAGAAALWLPQGERWRQQAEAILGLATVGLALLLTLGPYLYHAYPPPPEQGLGDGSIAAALEYERWSGTIGTTWGGEFTPVATQWVPREPPGSANAPRGRPAERLDRGALPPDSGFRARLLAQRGDYEAYQTSSPGEVTVLFRLIYYPAWRAYADGQELAVKPFTQHGLGWVTFTVPAGEHTLEVRFTPTPLAQVGNTLSLCAVALLIALGLVAAWRSGGWRRRASGRASRPGPPPSEVAPRRDAEGSAPPGTPAYREAGRRPDGAGSGAQAQGLAAVAVVLTLVAARLLVFDANPGWFRYASAPFTAPPAQHKLAANFEERIVAVGYSLDRETARPGEALAVELFWELTSGPTTDYLSEVSLLAAPGAPPLARAEGLLVREKPTSKWQTGRFYPDPVELVLPADLRPGEYTLALRLLDARADRRPLALAGIPGGQTQVVLGTVTVP